MGAEACELASLCEGLNQQCSSDEMFVGLLENLQSPLDLQDADGRRGDYVLQNDKITVVIDSLGEPHDLAPTGGTIIDLGVRGGNDDVNQLYQIAGILPDDAFAYTSIQLVDQSPDMVALVARGTLSGRSEVDIVTRYELRACEEGLRIRTELSNGTPDVLSLTIADVSHWGQRNAVPFAPAPSEGFAHPELSLRGLQDAVASYDYVLARAAEANAPSYGFLRCDKSQIKGVNSSGLSALGTAIGIVRPGEQRNYQRFISVQQSSDLGAATAFVSEARTMLHGDPLPEKITGEVVAEGLAFEGGPRRGTILISEDLGDGSYRPLTTASPDAMGHVEATVTSRNPLLYELWSFGRVIASGRIASGLQRTLGTIEAELPARLSVSVTAEGAASYATLVVHPADSAEEERLQGTLMGGGIAPCAPWLGPAAGSSPACNLVTIEPQGTDFELPAGRYQLWFTAGTDWSLKRVDVEIGAGEVEGITVNLQSVPVAPPNWLSADLHVHGSASFDSSLPNLDRVRTFIAHGIDVIAATDHDFVTDYQNAVDALGLGEELVVMGGLETTSGIPFMEVPGESLPKTIGHFNHWPMLVDPLAPRGGAPWDEGVEPGDLFELLTPFMGEEPIHMLNHPWDDPDGGRDLGYLRAIGFDPRVPIKLAGQSHQNAFLEHAASGGTRNIDFDLIEVQNGVTAKLVLQTRVLWFSLLSQGFVQTGVANSDSHDLTRRLGFGRSYVDAGMDVASFDVATFNRALKDGKVVAGNGVVVLVSIVSAAGELRKSLGFTPYQPQPGDLLDIQVRAPPWVPVDVVRVVSSKGEVVIASGSDLVHPTDPLGTEGVVRYKGRIPLLGVLPNTSDSWVLVEAGLEFQPTADLNDDGVPDTSDNNGDGVVDVRDVADGESVGPLDTPASPSDPSDPRYAMTRVLPKAWPYGFSNPILLDRAGDGWSAPGLPSP